MISEYNKIDINKINKLLLEFNYKLDFNNEFRKCYTYKLDNEVIGVIVYERIYDRIEIDYIIVDEKYRNKAIATKLLKHLECNNLDIKNITLEVRKSNKIAISFYKKNGFNEVCIRKNYYSNEDAILMIKEYGGSKMKDIYILGIESSCDETSVSIVKNGVEEISTVVLSQMDIHASYGGVVPEIASRMHVESITIVIEECLKKAGMTMDDITAIAVTYGPGLIGCLLIGVSAATTLSYIYNKPLIPVHHIAGHIYANNLVSKMNFPLIALVISGGHTELIYMKEDYSFEKIGGTLDDAVGECYDKVARVINLPYPGGPLVDKLSYDGKDTYKLPLPLDDNSYNFSFSGIKSAVINLVHNERQRGNDIRNEDIACSFQNRVVEILTKKTFKALKEYNVKNLIIAGGVSANTGIRAAFINMCKEKGINLCIPNIKYCTDNGAMIAVAGYYAYKKGIRADIDLKAVATTSLFDIYNKNTVKH